ncbi:hypothetical protein [Streptomyces sp. NPDC018610]|uniref:hypothetical protein n=1 Tax=Streptomyces sp. NPDC018610 TaxID=3365049 RepID=UPI0037B782E0
MSGRADSETPAAMSRADAAEAAGPRDETGSGPRAADEDGHQDAGKSPATEDTGKSAATEDSGRAGETEATGPIGATGDTDTEEPEDAGGPEDGDDPEDPAEVARRARWTASGAGSLLTLAGIAASLLRLARSAPALVVAAYATGAAVCALAALLGFRGRTRRALWLMIAGVMVMALGDQFD